MRDFRPNGLTLGSFAMLPMALGIGWAIGAFYTFDGDTATESALATIPLHATATHGDKNLTIATGQIAEGTEAVFFLDNANGTLRALLLNKAGAVGAIAEHSVLDDLRVDRAKVPSFLMVTGRANLLRGNNALSPGDSIVYVVESATGRYAAYAVWLNKGAFTVGRHRVPLRLELKLLRQGEARDTADFRNLDQSAP